MKYKCIKTATTGCIFSLYLGLSTILGSSFVLGKEIPKDYLTYQKTAIISKMGNRNLLSEALFNTGLEWMVFGFFGGICCCDTKAMKKYREEKSRLPI